MPLAMQTSKKRAS